jgi:hypothetical protein
MPTRAPTLTKRNVWSINIYIYFSRHTATHNALGCGSRDAKPKEHNTSTYTGTRITRSPSEITAVSPRAAPLAFVVRPDPPQPHVQTQHYNHHTHTRLNHYMRYVVHHMDQRRNPRVSESQWPSSDAPGNTDDQHHDIEHLVCARCLPCTFFLRFNDLKCARARPRIQPLATHTAHTLKICHAAVHTNSTKVYRSTRNLRRVINTYHLQQQSSSGSNIVWRYCLVWQVSTR